MKQSKSEKKLMIIMGTILIGMIIIFSIVSLASRSRIQDGVKIVEIEVIHRDGSVKKLKYKTEQNYLGQVLKKEKLIDGLQNNFGTFITVVDGEMADEFKQEWWCVTSNGEMVMSTVDEIVLEKTNKFELTLTTGYN